MSNDANEPGAGGPDAVATTIGWEPRRLLPLILFELISCLLAFGSPILVPEIAVGRHNALGRVDKRALRDLFGDIRGGLLAVPPNDPLMLNPTTEDISKGRLRISIRNPTYCIVLYMEMCCRVAFIACICESKMNLEIAKCEQKTMY